MKTWTFLLLLGSVSSDLYSSTVDVEKLLELETMVIQTFKLFISEVEPKIIEIKRNIERCEYDHQIALENINYFLSSPLNSYVLVKRLLLEWIALENHFDNLMRGFSKNITEIKVTKGFPTTNDLEGATEALIRLRETYDMDISSLASGKLDNVQLTTELSANDCFLIGRQAFIMEKFPESILWMDEALSRLQKDTDMKIPLKWEILEFVAYSTYKLGNFSKALSITNEILEIYPDHPRMMSNKEYFLEKLGEATVASIGKIQNKETEGIEQPSSELYEMTCRKVINPPVSIISQLKCRYITNNIPFLRLAPLKEEEAYLNPRIVLFKEALYESEIETIKTLAKPKLTTALVSNETEGASVFSKSRIGKYAWLADDEHPVIRAIGQRVEDMTNLSVSTAEQLQVVNYGVGGHYEPHYDYFLENEKMSNHFDTGNRIATLLFYMNNVVQGGATVFPNLRLSIQPEKGTAILWLNLLPDGKGDTNTLHAACPVVAGSKWICNKWFHERGQEFRRPCELKPSNGV